MEIRRSYDRLISTMGFPILIRWHLYIESRPWQMRFHSYRRLQSHYAPLPSIRLLMLVNNLWQLALRLIGWNTPTDLWDCGHTKGWGYGGLTDWQWGKLWNKNSVRWLEYCHRLPCRSPNQYRLCSAGRYTIKGHPMDSMINIYR